MEAIGAAQMRSAAAHASNGLGRASAQPSGGVVAPTVVEPIVTTTRVTPVGIELTTVQGDELLAAQSLVQRAGLPITLSEASPSPSELIAEVRREQRGGSPAPGQSIALHDQINSLMQDLMAGRGDQAQTIVALDALRKLVKVVQRSEDRRDLLKKLIIQAMLGAVTPELLRTAKALGMEEIVKRVIADAVKQGLITRSVAAPLAAALQAVGIQVPELDVLVGDLQASETRREAAVVDARRSEELLTKDPQASGSVAGGVAGASIASASAGVRAFE